MDDMKKSRKQLIEENRKRRLRKRELERFKPECKRTEEELKQSKELFSNTVNALDDPFFVKDEEHRWVILNDAACEVMGRPREELIGKSDYELFPKEQADVFWERDSHVLETGQTDTHEEEITWHGKLHTISTKKSVFTDSVTGKKFITGTIRDITERKEAEEELKESERKFRAAVENSPDFIVFVKRDGTIYDVNRLEKGFTREMVIGKSIFNKSWYETKEQVRAAKKQVKSVFRTGKPDNYEYSQVAPDGSRSFYETRVAPFERDTKNGVISIQCATRDITERKELEERLSAIVYKSPIATAVGGADGSIIAFNEALETLIGYKKSEVSDVADWTNKLYPDKEYREFVWKNIQQALDGKEQDCTEFTVTCKDGSTKVVDFHTSFFKGGLVIQMVDITVRRRAEDLAVIQRDLAVELSGATGLEEGLRLCIEGAIEASGMDCGGAYLIDDKSGALELKYHTGLSPDFVRSVTQYEVGSANMSLVMKGKPVYAEHVSMGVSLDKVELKEGLNAIAVLPILHKDQVVGCLNVASHTLNEVPDWSRAALETIAAQVGGAIARLKAEEALRYRLAFEELVTTLSTQFINLSTEEIDEGICQLLEKVGIFADVDRSYVFQLSENGTQMTNTHEWCVEGIDSEKHHLQELEVESFFWGTNQFKKSGVLNIQCVSDLPPEASVEREILQAGGIKSLVSVPIVIGGEPIGFLGFDTVRKERNWSDDTVSMLEIVAQILANALERKRAEDVLRIERDNFVNILDSMEDGVYIVDQSYDFQYVNPVLKKDFGPFEGRKCYEYFHDRKEVCPWCKNKEVFEGKTVRWEWYSFKNQRTYDLIDTPLRNPDGSISKLEIFRDITDRKQAEEALRESEERFRTLFESAPDAIYLNDLEGHFVDGNRVAEELAGFTRNELIGKNFLDTGLLSEEQVPRAIANLKKSAAGEPTGPDEFVMSRKDGSDITLEIRTYPVKIGEQKLSLGIARDITERKRAEEALRESENKYRMLFENTSMQVSFWSVNDWRILSMNAAGARKIGITVEEAIGKTTDEVFYDPEAAERARKIFKEVLESGKGIQTEDCVEILKDVKVWFRSDIQSLTDETGQVTAIQTITEDITERKKAEEALRISEECFKGIYENAMIGLYRTTPDGRILMANPALLRMLRYSSFEELVQRNLEKDGYHPEYPRSIFKERMEAEGRITGLESVWLNRDGTTLNVRESARAIRDNLGNTLYYEGTVEDITEHKKAKRALQESEARYRAIVEDQTELICRYLPDFTITFVNETYCRCFDRSREELVGHKFMPLIPEEDQAKVKEYFASLGPDRPVATHEHRVIMPDNHVRWQRWTNRAIFDNDGNIIEFQGVGRDITERKEAEEALKESEEKFRNLAEQSPNMIFINKRGRVVYVNKRCEEVMGYTREEFYHPDFDFMTLIAQENTQLIKTNFSRHIKGEEIKPYEYGLITKDGKRLDAIITSKLIKFDGEASILGIITDITERKKAERHVYEQRRFLRETIDSLTHPFCVIDANDYTIKMANTAAGESLELNEGITCHLLMHKSDTPCDSSENICPIKEIMRTGKPAVAEHIHYNKEGNRRVFEVRAYPIFDQENNISQVIEYTLDITDRKEAVKQLRESEEKYRSFVQNFKGIAYRGDMYFRPIFFHGNVEKITGYTADEFITGKVRLDKIIYPEDFTNIVEKEVKNMKTVPDYVCEHEYRLVHKDGQIRWIHECTQNICDDDGRPVMIQGVVYDITQRKEAEVKIMTYQHNLRSLTSRLISTEEHQRRQIAANLHDNASQSLALSVNRLRSLRESVASADTGTLDEICQTLEEVSQNVRDLTFDLSSPTLYKLGLEAAISELLTEQLRDCYGIACKLIDDKKDKPLDDEVRVLLFQAVRELLINVTKHSKANNVEVAIKRKKNNIQIIVNDDGIGFDTEKAEKSIQRSGGFGLFSIRERLDYIGGSFQMDAQPGKGSRFILTVPIKT